MKVTAKEIPCGSYEIRVWLNEEGTEGDSGADVDTMGVLTPVVGDPDIDGGLLYTADLGLVMGVLTDDVNISIALKVIELGYKHLTFHRTSGGKATRWATLVKQENGMDYYHVDLLAQLEKYKRSF